MELTVAKQFDSNESGTSEWGYQRLIEIASVTAGGTPSRSTPAFWDGTIPWVTTAEIDFGVIRITSQRISSLGLENSAAKMVTAGAILLALYGQGKTRGKVAQLGIDASTNQACAAIQVKKGVSSEYVFHFLAGQYRSLRKISNSGSQDNLNSSIVKNILVAVPPTLDEQKAIAEALSDADGLVESLERLITKKRRIKLGAMQELLTGKRRLPGFEGKWETRRLADLATIKMGQSPPSQFYNRRGNGLPLIQGNADIKNRRTIERVWTTQASKQCDAGDVLLTVRAPVGAVGLAVTDACLGRGVCGIKSHDDQAFLFHALINAEPRWSVLEQGSTFTSANSSQVGSFMLQAPFELGEQRAIATVLYDIDTEIEALKSRLTKAKRIKEGMMQQLLTGRIRLV